MRPLFAWEKPDLVSRSSLYRLPDRIYKQLPGRRRNMRKGPGRASICWCNGRTGELQGGACKAHSAARRGWRSHLWAGCLEDAAGRRPVEFYLQRSALPPPTPPPQRETGRVGEEQKKEGAGGSTWGRPGRRVQGTRPNGPGRRGPIRTQQLHQPYRHGRSLPAPQPCGRPRCPASGGIQKSQCTCRLRLVESRLQTKCMNLQGG